MNRIAYTKPSIGELEEKYVSDAIKNGWGERCYDYIYRLEDSFSNYIGVKHSVATSSCTGALHLGLSAIGVKKYDEVILADINWVATVAPVIHLGATPVFVDILPDTWCIDPKKVVQAITPNTKAIICTHIYGNLCDLNELRAICDKYSIYLIEDCAEAIGSRYEKQSVGTIGDYSVFSFHGTKTITTGEGGILVSNNKEIIDKVKMLNNHGRSEHERKQFWASEIGYKFKMSNIQAAIGVAQLERVNDLVKRRQEILCKYKEILNSEEQFTLNYESLENTHGAWMPTVVVAPEVEFNRDHCIEKLKARGIDARVFFWPLSSMPMFDEVLENTQAYSISKRGLNLPSYFDMQDSDIEYVCETFLKNLR